MSNQRELPLLCCALYTPLTATTCTHLCIQACTMAIQCTLASEPVFQSLLLQGPWPKRVRAPN